MHKSIVLEDGEWWYYDTDLHRRRYMSAEAYNKCCKMCGVSLDEENWAQGNLKKNVYVCRVCDSIKRKRNRLKKLALSIGEKTVNQYSKVKDGYVYAIINPAWPEWVKIGMAIDAEDRCGGYQTSSPFRDYEILHSCYVKDRRKAEKACHDRAEEVAGERSGEWFKVGHSLVKEVIISASSDYRISDIPK